MATKKRRAPWAAEGVPVNVGTDVASFVIANPGHLAALAAEDEAWWDSEVLVRRALAEGLAAGFATEQDGTFAMKWTRGSLGERERALVSDEAMFRLRVEGGNVLVGDPACFDPASPEDWGGHAMGIKLEDGAYRVHVWAIAWMEEAGATTPSGKRSKNALPSFVLSFERVGSLSEVAAPELAALPALRWDVSRARREVEAQAKAALDARRSELSALARAPSARDVEVLLAALSEPALRDAAQAALATAPTPAVAAPLVRALREELEHEAVERRATINALFLAAAPHRSSEAIALAERVLTTYLEGAGRVLLAGQSPQAARRLAGLLENPATPEKALQVAVEGAFALEASEAFDLLSPHLRTEAPSYREREVGRAILQRLGQTPADPRWRSLLFRAFDAGNFPACLVALAVARTLGPSNGDVAAIAKQALGAKDSAHRDDLLTWLRGSGDPKLQALASGS